MSTDMPFSVLNNKRKKISIVEQKEKKTREKTNLVDFSNSVNSMTEFGLTINEDHLIFFTNNTNIFYRNNLPILLLAYDYIMNRDIDRNKLDSYKKFVYKKNESYVNNRQFNEKFNVEFSAYIRKIQNFLNQNF